MTHRITLQDAVKRFTLDQDKIRSPRETVQAFRKKLSELNLDILAETVRIDNGRLGIPVYFSVCGRDAAAVTGTKKQMGKGATPEQAEASAVMELAERFSFFSFVRNPARFITDTYDRLREKALPFELIARSVHEPAGEAEASKNIFRRLPLKWTWGFNLTTGREVLAPFDWFYAINEFNGPCAGNCAEEALSQGVCEVVERHVSALVSRQKLRVPGIRAASATQPLVREMLEKYEKNGIKLFLSDFTLETGVPTVGALAYDPATFPEKSEIVWTAGTTPDPEKALSRALTEVAQLAGDFNSGSNYVASGLPKLAAVEDADFITRPDRHLDISELPCLADDNIKTEVLNMVDALARRDMQVIAVDIMHPDLNVPAYYVMIPGAHFRERAARGGVGMFCAKLVHDNNPPEKAAGLLAEMDRTLPDKYYIRFYLGSAFLARGRTDEALELFRSALALDPDPEDAASIYSYMGVCLKEAGEYEKALEVLEKGLSCDAERTDIYNLMGFCRFKLKQHAAAVECFEKALKLNPGSALDHANIAVNHEALGETERAVRHYETALLLDPALEFARNNLEKLKA